jgi:prepilin-type N-terminal cleavage/methylation domain-containing protein
MKKTRGFTLVELLVVIAIIALLMSILIPAMARVKRQAKAVLCQSNLRQWAIIFGMYTEDNEGYFCAGEVAGIAKLWTDATRSLYQSPKIRCCPMATKLYRDGARGTFAAWDMSMFWGGAAADDYGSYGLNEFLYNPPSNEDLLWGSPTKYNWRHINVKGASNVPMFLDCWWLGGGPTHKDAPPVFEGEVTGVNSDDMRRFCLNRHNKTVNGCFMDFSVRKIPLKCLWKFKWHREYNTNYYSPYWPTWMEKFPECD